MAKDSQPDQTNKFIAAQRKAGHSDQVIIKKLIQNGWEQAAANAAVSKTGAPKQSVGGHGTVHEGYVSNPFFASVKGLIKILQVNPGTTLLSSLYLIGIVIVAFLLTALVSMGSELLGGILLILAAMVLIPAISGMFYVIAACSVKGERIGLNAALGRSFKRLLPFIGLSLLTLLLLSPVVIMFTIICAASQSAAVIIPALLILIVPELYLVGRTLLAPVAFFEEHIGPIKALKRSLELTRGHVLEVLCAYFAGSLLTMGYGLLAPASTLAPIVGRYQDLVALKKSNAPKPPIHWWNYVLLLLPILVIGLYVLLVVDTFNNISERTKINNDRNDRLRNYNIYKDSDTQDNSNRYYTQ